MEEDGQSTLTKTKRKEDTMDIMKKMALAMQAKKKMGGMPPKIMPKMDSRTPAQMKDFAKRNKLGKLA